MRRFHAYSTYGYTYVPPDNEQGGEYVNSWQNSRMTHLRDVLINANLALLPVGNVLKALRFALSVLDATS